MGNNKKILIAWTAPEFSYEEKSPVWFIVFGILALIVLGIALFMRNYIFALIVLIASVLVYFEARRYPREIRFAISEEGILINDQTILHEHIISFWIFEQPETYISINSRKLLQSRIHIPAGNQDPQKLRTILASFAKEKEHEESFIDAFSRRLKF